jgi:hypothetical protein
MLYTADLRLYNINRSKKWVKNIQAAAYNGARTVVKINRLKENYFIF